MKARPLWQKSVLGLVAVLAVAVIALAVWFYGVLPRVAPPRDVKAPATPEALARGEYLATVLGCAGCHSEIDEALPGDQIKAGRLFSGRVFPVMPGLPAALVAANLTPDPETGVGSWTDGELMRAIREGIGRDGRALFPMMNYPSFSRLPDDDVLAIIAYIRHAAPIRNALPRTTVDFPVSMFIRGVPRPVEGSPPALPTEPLARGQALLKLMSCGDCHTPMERGAPVEGMEYAGGTCFDLAPGRICAPNITSHPASGIGAMTDEDLTRVFREGKGKDGRSLWLMPWSFTQKLTEDDLRALILALRAVPPNAALAPATELKPEFKGR